MKPEPGRTLVTVTATTALFAALAASALAGGQMPEPTQAFGFKVGEERRYVLGPPDKLDPGESAEWSISLDRFLETEDGWQVRFAFTHDRLERIPGSLDQTDLIGVNTYGTFTTNLDGFPMEVEFVQEFSLGGETMAGSDVRRVQYVYDRKKKRYDKELSLGRRDMDFDFGVAGYDRMDFDVPRGLFLFGPATQDCLGVSQVLCVEGDPAFINPGFLSLILPPLLDEPEGERNFMFFIPTTASSVLFVPTSPSDIASRERNSIGNLQRYFERYKVKLGPSVDIEVGPRTMRAWEMDLGGGIDKVWIQQDGTVVRLDLDTTYDARFERQIRLIHPFEEFLSPNKDPDNRECC